MKSAFLNFKKKRKEIIVVYVHFNCVTMSDSSPSGQGEYKW